jgi:hypothetical protein
LPPSGRDPSKLYQPLLLLGAALYLYCLLFRLPGTPFLLNGDQVYFWMHGLQMLQGEHVYRDFFQVTPPGADVFYFGLFRILGPWIWVTNLAVLLLGVAMCWAAIRLSRWFMSTQQAALAGLLFLTLIYGRLINATHHWFSVGLILCAMTCLMPARTNARVACAGLLLGAAAFFTQTHAEAATLAILLFLAWERSVLQSQWRGLLIQLTLLLAAVGVAMVVLYAPYLADIGFRQLWYFLVTYVHQYLVTGLPPDLGLPLLRSSKDLPVFIQAVAVYAMVAVVYPLVLLRCWSRRAEVSSEENLRLALVSLVGFLLLVEVVFSLNWLRLYTVSAPAVVLLIWAVNGPGQVRRYARCLLWGIAAVLAMVQIGIRQAQPMRMGELPGGRVAANPQAFDKLQWLAQHTAPGEALYQAAWPGLYLPLALRTPIFLDCFSTYVQTRPEYIERAVAELDQNRVRYILWQPRLNQRDPSRSWEYQFASVSEYLHRQYRRVHVFPDQDEVWERR